MEAIKCDICKRLEAGVGNRIVLHYKEYTICSKCIAKIDGVVEKETKNQD